MKKNILELYGKVLILVLLIIIIAKYSYFASVPHLLDFSRTGSTLECENFQTIVDLKSHPCGGPIGSGESHEVVVDKTKSEVSKDRVESFERIYKDGFWKSHGDSKSGLGSTTDATKKIINILNQVVDYLKIVLNKDKISILDSSCGDMNWMPRFLENRTDIDFTGYDITLSNIEAHQLNFANKSWTFKQHDLVADPITVKFDLIISRHTLMHLFFSDIQKALDNIEKSGSEFLLMTTQSNEKNQELSSGLLGRGRYRPVNFFKQPFSFSSPVCIGKDTNEPNMFIVLYNIKSIHSIQATNNYLKINSINY